MVADWLIVPCDADKESLQSLRRTIEVAFTYVEHRPELDPTRFYRVLRTIVDERETVINGWLEEELRGLGAPVFTTAIHRATAFKKARGYGLSIFAYHARHRGSGGAQRGAADFDQLTEEVMSYVRGADPAEWRWADLPPRAQRVDHLAKAQRLTEQARGRAGEAPAAPPVTKLTTRLATEQVAWLKGEAKGYRDRHPRRPRVTLEELLAIAIDHLREAKDLDSVIGKHRS